MTMPSHSPMVLIDRLKRAGLSAREIAQRTHIHDSMIRKLRRGVAFDNLSDEQIARLAKLASEVGPPPRPSPT